MFKICYTFHWNNSKSTLIQFPVQTSKAKPANYWVILFTSQTEIVLETSQQENELCNMHRKILAIHSEVYISKKINLSYETFTYSLRHLSNDILYPAVDYKKHFLLKQVCLSSISTGINLQGGLIKLKLLVTLELTTELNILRMKAEP